MMDDPCREIPPIEKHLEGVEQSRQNTVYLEIQGLNCRNCACRVQNALLSTFGVTSVIIDQVQGLGEVRYNPDLTSPAALVDTVQAAGGDGIHNYEARVLSLD